MTDFEVDTWGLDQLRKFFDQLAGHAEAARSYLNNHTTLEGGEGWLNDLSGAHDSITQQGSDWFRDFAANTLDPAAAATKDALDYYDATDTDSAATFDAQIDGVAAAEPVELTPSATGPGSNPTTFGIAQNPEDSLVALKDYSDDDNYRIDWDLTRYIGVTGALRQAFIDATKLMTQFGWIDKPIDPYDAWAEPVAGDWAAMRRTADVYRNLANAVDSFETVLLHARVDLPEVWTGNAATACDYFIEDLRSKMPDAASEMRAVADIYETASVGAHDFRAVLDYVIDQIGDAIIALALSIGAGAASAPTVVGPLVAGGVAIYEATLIKQGLEMGGDAKGIWESTYGAAKSSLNGYGQINASDYYLPTLPQPNAEGSSMSHLPE